VKLKRAMSSPHCLGFGESERVVKSAHCNAVQCMVPDVGIFYENASSALTRFSDRVYV